MESASRVDAQPTGRQRRGAAAAAAIEPRLLVVRHARYQHQFYDILSWWIARFAPQFQGLLDIRNLPFELPPDTRRGAPWGALVAWLQDPVENWSMRTLQRALALQQACEALGMPVLNRVDRLPNAVKAAGAALMAAAGVRTPAMALITDAQAFRHDLLGVPLPLFVREDWGHGGLMLEAQTLQQARSIALERFKRPVAVQKIDTSDAQGVFRRYRYFAASDAGISQNVHWSTDWVTRADGRIETEEAQAGERAYTGAPNPHHALFQAARRALGLDMVAIDYGLLPDGQPVLWEANPFPVVAFLHRVPEYRNLAMHRMVAAILRMYLQAVGLAVPPEIEDFVQYRSDGAALLEAGWKRGLGTAR